MMKLMQVHKTKTETDSVSLDGLMLRLSQGDPAALETLYVSMSASVYAYALSVLKCVQDAEDVLHDCFVNIYAAAGAYQGKGKAKAWIMTIAHNLCMQKLRERRRMSDLPQEDWERRLEASDGVSPEDKLMLEHCMNRLSDEERQILVLHAVSGFKHREIAAMLRIPLSTALSKYNRAIKKLRESM